MNGLSETAAITANSAICTDTSRIKPIPSLPGYFATERGTIIGKHGTPRAPRIGKGVKRGYAMLCIMGKTRYVHQLVAEAFLGERPQGCETDHIDRDRLNNSASNLRYITHKQNMNNRSIK